jgi:glycosyltransferase involved in cell wall biosynthesis
MNEINSTDYLVVNPDISSLTGDIIDFRNLPCISFCIPTLNNESTLEACLSSISTQNYPKFEIIIIDGFSNDRTIDIAKKYTKKIYYDKGTYGSACQTGVEHSSGKILALFDSDIILPHNNWLINAVRYFNYSDRVSTVWPLYIAPPNSPLFEHLYQTNLYRILIENRISKKKSFFGGGNSLILKECIEEIGGINRSIHWGADFDWAKKLKGCNYQVIFILDPLYHDTMRSIREFAKKQFTGAKTFTKSSFEIMGLSNRDIFYEQLILGTRGMIRGLIIERDISWILFPILLLIRFIAYGFVSLSNIKNK